MFRAGCIRDPSVMYGDAGLFRLTSQKILQWHDVTVDVARGFEQVDPVVPTWRLPLDYSARCLPPTAELTTWHILVLLQ